MIWNLIPDEPGREYLQIGCFTVEIYPAPSGVLFFWEVSVYGELDHPRPVTLFQGGASDRTVAQAAGVLAARALAKEALRVLDVGHSSVFPLNQ